MRSGVPRRRHQHPKVGFSRGEQRPEFHDVGATQDCPCQAATTPLPPEDAFSEHKSPSVPWPGVPWRTRWPAASSLAADQVHPVTATLPVLLDPVTASGREGPPLHRAPQDGLRPSSAAQGPHIGAFCGSRLASRPGCLLLFRAWSSLWGRTAASDPAWPSCRGCSGVPQLPAPSFQGGRWLGTSLLISVGQVWP